MGLIMLRPLTHPPRLEQLRVTVRTAAAVSGATLFAFHGCLFAAQAAQGRLEDPWLALRWLIAAAVVAVLAAIRHAGGSIWNRQGLAVWVVAALLHGPAVTTDFGNSINLAPPETVATAFLESLVAVSALAVTVWMLAGLIGLRDRHARLYVSAVTPRRVGVTLGDGFSPAYSSRPPPRRH